MGKFTDRFKTAFGSGSDDEYDDFDDYYEDDDMSLQIRAAGYELVVCHNSFIYHMESQSYRKRV